MSSNHALATSAARRDSTAAAEEVAHILTALGAPVRPIPSPKTEPRHVEGGWSQPSVKPTVDGDGSPPLRCPTSSEEGGGDGNASISSEGSFRARVHRQAPVLWRQPQTKSVRHKLDREDGDDAGSGEGRQWSLELRTVGGKDDGAAPADAKPPPAPSPAIRLQGRRQEEDNDDGPAPALSFPEALFEVVSDPENAKAISWLPHGKGFTIHDNGLFMDVLNTHFDGAKFTSFTRRLKRWNFDRVSRGPEMGSYYNRFFQRDAPELIQRMQYGPDGKNGRTVSSASSSDGKGAGKKDQQTAAVKRSSNSSSAPFRKRRAATVSKKGPKTKYQEELRRQEQAEELSRYHVELQMQMQTGQFPMAMVPVPLSEIAMYGRGRDPRGSMQPLVMSNELGFPPSMMAMHGSCHNERGDSGREGKGYMLTGRGLSSDMMPPPRQMQGYDAKLISLHDQQSHNPQQAPVIDVERRRFTEMGYPPSIHLEQVGRLPMSHRNPSSSRDRGVPQDYGPSSALSHYAHLRMERELARLEAIHMQDRLHGGGFPPSCGGEHMLTMTSVSGSGRSRTPPSQQGGQDRPYYSTSPAAAARSGRCNKDSKMFSPRIHEEAMMMTDRELGERPVPSHSSSARMIRTEYGGGDADQTPASPTGAPMTGDVGRIGHRGGMTQSTWLPDRTGIYDGGMPHFYSRGRFGGGHGYANDPSQTAMMDFFSQHHG